VQPLPLPKTTSKGSGLLFPTGLHGDGDGVGAYSAGLFHLMTHAYFKTMLFLGSGSVIHGMEGVVGHDQPSPGYADDGGWYMPFTAITFLIGCLAISGIPPFAGFWSKDEILGSAFANPVLWGVG